MRYRKKPLEIEAIQYTGNNYNEVCEFVGDKLKTLHIKYEPGELIIETLEGNMTAKVNDYIIKGIHGEFYPCKPNIFNKSYELVK